MMIMLHRRRLDQSVMLPEGCAAVVQFRVDRGSNGIHGLPVSRRDAERFHTGASDEQENVTLD